MLVKKIFNEVVIVAILAFVFLLKLFRFGDQFLTRFNKIAIPNNKFQQVDKEAIGLSRVQQFSHLCVARPYQISVNSIFKHIHTTSINTIIWQFVPFIYHPL